MAERRSPSIDATMPKIVHVHHLGGIDVSYRMAKSYRQNKPTLILINSFTTCAELYRGQLHNAELSEAMNLVAIEPLGHGDTRTRVAETFTYWDSAIMIQQAMDALGIKKAFLTGISQGGWIAARIALYAPDKVRLFLLFTQSPWTLTT
jgi:pimeloyl-ACP methyl ester carboxylesterase